jgi:hypothetical protein
MEFRVGDVARAASILRDAGLDVSTDTDRVFVPVEEDQAPPLIAALTTNGVAVFHARQRMQSLEEMFIEATGGETVG